MYVISLIQLKMYLLLLLPQVTSKQAKATRNCSVWIIELYLLLLIKQNKFILCKVKSWKYMIFKVCFCGWHNEERIENLTSKQNEREEFSGMNGIFFLREMLTWVSWVHSHACSKLPLVSNQHDDHVRTRMLPSIFKPCCQVVECVSPEIRF